MGSRRRSAYVGFSVLTLSASGLAGCEDQQPKVYSSVADCRAEHPGQACDDAWQASVGEHDQTAPRYPQQAACEAQYGVGHCETREGGGFFMPMMAGFVMGQMMNGGGYGNRYVGHPVFFAPGGGYRAPAFGAGESMFTRSGFTGSGTTRGGFAPRRFPRGLWRLRRRRLTLAQRIRLPVRSDWRAKVEERGLTWHTAEDGTPYWDESAYWLFSEAEIDRIEAATTELYDMCLQAIGHVIDQKQLASFGYDAATIALIEQSWSRRSWQPTLYARFDLAYDGQQIKLLELNGDTPTSLVEAAVAQWWWLEERFPDADQFNSIHEKLVAALSIYRQNAGADSALHLTCVTPHLEDQGTVEYIAAAASEAGVETRFIALGDIGLRDGVNGGQFVDLDDQPIRTLFKLVPWEWLLADPFGQALAREAGAERIGLIEPAWKMAASNKQLLVTLSELFQDSEYLLDSTCSAEVAAGYGDYVKKPVRGREGANVTLVEAGQTLAANPAPMTMTCSSINAARR